jgi:hypothetical protein
MRGGGASELCIVSGTVGAHVQWACATRQRVSIGDSVVRLVNQATGKRSVEEKELAAGAV